MKDIKTLASFGSETELKNILWTNYAAQIKNYFGDEKKALKFLSGVVSAVQRTPELLECTPISVVNSFMIMAGLELMPSDVSGEAYVLPYNNRKQIGPNQWEKVKEAQFQLGYQGLITLLYRAGAKDVVAELVRENDKFSIVRGKIFHEVDPMKTREQRGKAIGAYAIITTTTGGTVEQFMRMEDILAHAKKFSKSYDSKFTPWNPDNDPEGWMPRKTILKQTAKLAPKNETINRAIAEDNKDSNLADRLDAAKKDVPALSMGNLIKDANQEPKNETEKADASEGQDPAQPAESAEDRGGQGELPSINLDEE